MPVTAKLSRKFYERFGDDVTNELVEWFNQVETSYRGELRELNELNWDRFKSELAAMRAETRAEMAAAKAELVRWMFLFWATTLIALVGIARLK